MRAAWLSIWKSGGSHRPAQASTGGLAPPTYIFLSNLHFFVGYLGRFAGFLFDDGECGLSRSRQTELGISMKDASWWP